MAMTRDPKNTAMGFYYRDSHGVAYIVFVLHGDGFCTWKLFSTSTQPLFITISSSYDME